MEIEHVLFSLIHKNVGNLSKIGVHTSNCVLKSGLKNNWMKKLDRVNRPLENVGSLILRPETILNVNVVYSKFSDYDGK